MTVPTMFNTQGGQQQQDQPTMFAGGPGGYKMQSPQPRPLPPAGSFAAQAPGVFGPNFENKLARINQRGMTGDAGPSGMFDARQDAMRQKLNERGVAMGRMTPQLAAAITQKQNLMNSAQAGTLGVPQQDQQRQMLAQMLMGG